ncbi:MAG: glycoside hydrolase family 9 [Actinomycetales bacterium]|nr:glycoside hydrolase family 9 [Actinomycetales bacterium]
MWTRSTGNPIETYRQVFRESLPRATFREHTEPGHSPQDIFRLSAAHLVIGVSERSLHVYRGDHRRAFHGVAGCGAVALTIGLLTGGAGPVDAASPTLTSTPYGNLSEALQKSIYFYDAEKSGPARSMDRQPLEWRADSEPEDAKIELVTGKLDAGQIVVSGTNLSSSFISKYRSVLDPDGDGYLDLSQGFHDAGDHVKFGLPQSFAASTLAWGVYEFKDAYVETGSYDHIMDQLYWFNDYFLKSTFRDSSGKVIAFNYQVGNGSIDHTEWTPPELLHHPRGAMFATAETPGSDQAAGASAALTAMSLLTAEDDPAYSKRCFEAGKALYEFAVANRGIGFSGGFYGSAYDEDELSWAAAWLFAATKDVSYVDAIAARNSAGEYTGYMKKIISDPRSTWQNIWVHSWDVVWGGAFALLAPLTKGVVSDTMNTDFWFYFRWNIEYWTAGAVEHMGNISGNAYMEASPGGFSVVNGWGSARYNTAAQLCALVYRKHAAADPLGSVEHGVELSQWALSQMNYIMGDNPLNRSYIVGFTARETDHHVQHPHHRAAHGSLTNSMFDPPEHRHILWGALAGGPDMKDQHNDETRDFVYNEVTIDYNAGFVGALAGLFTYFGSGQTNTVWTPPAEEKTNPFWLDAKVEQESNQRSQVSVRIHQETVTPPTLVDDLSARYYFDISELIDAGETVADVETAIYYDEAAGVGDKPATLTGPTRVGTSGNLYYVTISWPGAFIGKRDLQFGLIAKQSSVTYQDYWDADNDYSRSGLGSKEFEPTQRIPVYKDGTLVFGAEPEPGYTVTRSTTRTTGTDTGTGTTTTSTGGGVCWAPTGGSTAPAMPTGGAGSGGCTADYDLVGSWNSGYQGSVTVTNTGTSNITDWTVTWTCASGQSVYDLWGGVVAAAGGQALQVTNQSYNGSLAPGASTTFGVTGFLRGGSATPTLSCSAS